MAEIERQKILEEMEAWLAERQRAISLLKCVDSEILTAAIGCFESPAAVGHFLTTPARSLADMIPAEIANTPAGKQQVLRLIRAIDYGVYL